MKYDNLPQYIKDNGSFCLWKYEERKNGEKPIKVPYQVSGKKAMPNNEHTFTTFETALSAVNKFDGLGIGVFGGISAIDIDNCINQDGSLTDMAIAIITLFEGCYIEKSPSERGLRILFIATDFKYDKDRYYINNQEIGLEVYVCGVTNKFVTLTGDVVKNGVIINVTDKLQFLLDTYMLRSELPNQNNTNQNTCSYLSDDEVLLKAKASANAEKFRALWNGEIPTGKSHSEADMSLATILAFWCGRDIEQMDRGLFRKSSLMRDKWDRPQSGKTCRPETIGMKVNNSSSSPSEDVARLAGARFVNISEPDRKLTLSAALLKTLTGNDTINARFLHENSFDFKPKFKIFTNTNHLPIVTDLTLLTSGRVKIIPFERHFEEWEQDKGLKAEFTKEENLSGILNWVLDGYRKLKQTGFNVPSSVTEATLSYQRENDKVAQFIEEKLEENGNSEERTSEVYLAYQNWCRENGYYPENACNFKSALSNIGTIIRKRPRTGGEKTTMLIE